MFVITADQVDSRHRDDRVEAAIGALVERHGPSLRSRPERTAGDEFQLATAAPDTALAIVLELTRDGGWSVGLGVGAADADGPSVRAMSGDAFVRAREAVTAAKRRPGGFALVDGTAPSRIDPLIRLLLALRERRSPEGWELFDVLESDPRLTQTAAAERLGITVQAASQRALAGGIRLDREARESLTLLLADADSRSPEADERIGA